MEQRRGVAASILFIGAGVIIAAALFLAVRPFRVTYIGTPPDEPAARPPPKQSQVISCPAALVSALDTQAGGNAYLCHLAAPSHLLVPGVIGLGGIAIAVFNFVQFRRTRPVRQSASSP